MTTLQTSTPAQLCYLHLASKEPQRQVDFYTRMMDMRASPQADGSQVMRGPKRAAIISPADHSGLLAAALVVGALQLLAGPVGDLAALYGASFVLRLPGPVEVAVLAAAGAFLGWLGAQLSVSLSLRKFD